MKTSWKRCIEFSNVAQAYLKRTNGQETKLKYAISRTLARIQKQQETVNEWVADNEIDYCLTEKRGENDVIVRDSYGNLQYTKEAIKERNKKTREYLNGDKIEIEPYIASGLPSDLTELEIEAFSGFVIPAEVADRLLAGREGTTEEPAIAGQNGERSLETSLAV